MTKSLFDVLPQGVDNLHFKEELYILEVAQAVLAQMEQKGATITSMAASMDKTKGYLSSMLNGERNMTLRTVFRIAYALGVSPQSPIIHPSVEKMKESHWISIQTAKAKSNVIAVRPRALRQPESTYKFNPAIAA